MQSHRRKTILTALLGLAWVIAVAGGLRVVLGYDGSAGAVGIVPEKWPVKSQVHHATDRMTLLLLAHPRCPCTRATVGELAKVMADSQGKVAAYVLFFQPKNEPEKWTETELRRSAAAIPGVTVMSDIDGKEAHRFGAETSGHTLLYDREGRLLFSGGITESRGHAGGNKGESALLAFVHHEKAGQRTSLVFGCRIVDRTKPAEAFVCSK